MFCFSQSRNGQVRGRDEFAVRFASDDERVVELAIDLEFPGEAVDIELGLGPVFVGVRTLKFCAKFGLILRL